MGKNTTYKICEKDTMSNRLYKLDMLFKKYLLRYN